ncbi:MAG: PD-(D/E)XK nuclease family protein, partial [Clostridia bacterium]|nr:PD-(D/E)XK nuclease family protein [Clostridia bacterium]
LDTLDLLRERLVSNGIFRGRTVIFDSFKGFTGQEFAIIEQIMRQCDECVICLYADRSEPMGIFAPVADTAAKLVSIAKRAGVKVAVPERIEGTKRFGNDAVRHLESAVFRRDSEPFEGGTDCVTVYTASGRHDELEFCARECRRLIREEGFRCRDIAVIARNDAMYSDIALDAFEMQGLPLFFDRRADIESSALIRLVSDALSVAANGRNTDDMVRIAKSGLVTGISREDAFETENYCLVWGVRGAQWKESFDQNPDGLQGSMNEARAARLDAVNRVRERVESLTSSLREGMSGRTGKDMAAALYRFAQNAGVKEQLDPKCDDDRQIWQLFVSLLDRIAAVLGDTKPSNADFASLFGLMCSLADIGHIPQGQDEIVFSSPERFRPGAPKAVFIVGAADGEFPSTPSEAGVFTDDERIKLIELGLPVAQPFEYRIMEERLLVYTALTCASDYVYITYPEASAVPGDEVSAVPSELVTEVLRCLPDARKIRYCAQPGCRDTEAPDAAFELLARSLRSQEGEDAKYARALSEELSKIDGFTGKIKLLEEMRDNRAPSLSEAAAKKLFGKSMSISPTAAETYHHCRFRYFCQNALGVKAMQKARTAPNIYGTLLHYVFEKYLSENPEGDIKQNVKIYIERFIEEELGGEKGKNPRLLDRIRSAASPCTAAVANLLEELSESDFRPVAFELRLSGDETKAQLPDGSFVA